MGNIAKPSGPYVLWIDDDRNTIDVEEYELETLGPVPIESVCLENCRQVNDAIMHQMDIFFDAQLIIFDVLMPDLGIAEFTRGLPTPVGVQLCEKLLNCVQRDAKELLEIKGKTLYYTRTLAGTIQYERAVDSAKNNGLQFVAGSATSRAVLQMKKRGLIDINEQGIEVKNSQKEPIDLRGK